MFYENNLLITFGHFQGIESIEKSFEVSSQSEQQLKSISSQFNDALRLDSFEQPSDAGVCFICTFVLLFLVWKISLFSRCLNSGKSTTGLSNCVLLQEQNVLLATDGPQRQDLLAGQQDLIIRQSTSDNSNQSLKPLEMPLNSVANTLSEKTASSGQKNILPPGKTSEIALLDERSLLACIVRTIPAGGRIRISSTVSTQISLPLGW